MIQTRGTEESGTLFQTKEPEESSKREAQIAHTIRTQIRDKTISADCIRRDRTELKHWMQQWMHRATDRRVRGITSAGISQAAQKVWSL